MYDVAIIGAGVVGSAIARELARFRLRVAVVDAGSDACTGSSKANSGIVHSGYDANPGSLKAKYNVLGNPLFPALAEELDFPFKPIGSLVLAFGADEAKRLEELRERGRRNGVPGLRIVDREELAAMEPNVGPGAVAALAAPSGGIVCPYEMTIALAENAAANGVAFLLGHRVGKVTREGGRFRLDTSRDVVESRLLVNAAGLNADVINNMLSRDQYRITPRRGEYILLDRSEGGLARHTLFQLPSAMGKGILVTPTVDGNILIGPTSEDIDDKENRETTAEGMLRLAVASGRHVAAAPMDKVIASFTGLRAHLDHNDFVVGPCPDVPGLVNLIGISSPGLTSAPAIARDVAGMIRDMAKPAPNPAFNPVRRAPPRFRHMSTDERRAAIARDPRYGHIICRCEQVTEAEIAGALTPPLGAGDLDAIKRRTRAGMGRCQGGFCSMRLPALVADIRGIPVTKVSKFGGGSKLLLRRNKS